MTQPYRSIVCLLLLAVAFPAASQVIDTVSAGPGYIHQTYYKLSTRQKTAVNATVWDLQIAINLFSASIRVNDGHGVQLYAPSNQDTTVWSTLDTTGMTPLYNSDQEWERGAFNAQAGTHPDYGWGTYVAGGNILGTKLFVIKLHDGSFRKIWIVSLAVGKTYTIRHANLDGSDEATFTITKTDYTSSFVYIDVANSSVYDYEPSVPDWDLMFRRYLAELAPGVYYPVVGVQQNYNVEVAEARGVDVTSDDFSAFTFDSSITVMGHDWKEFNMTTFQWEIEPDLAYFVKDQAGVVYKIIFTEFGGAADGNFIFEVKSLAVGIEETGTASLGLFPNPARDEVMVRLPPGLYRHVVVRVADIRGREVMRFEETTQRDLLSLDVASLLPGLYTVTLTGGHAVVSGRIIIQ